MAIIMDGKYLRDKILAQLKNRLGGAVPTLAVILVGDNNEASQIYVRNKEKFAAAAGINSRVIRMAYETSTQELLSEIYKLNNDESITAMLVQLPLPKHIDEAAVINAISPDKDADGFTPINIGKLVLGWHGIAPATPRGIIALLDEYKINIDSMNAVVIGRSNIVGKPIAQMLTARNATVTLCHSHTKNLQDITKNADIIVCATGRPVLHGNMVKQGATVIDVGIFHDENGKLRGDVDFESVSEFAGYITPVPGGIGPMTIAGLMMNTVDLFFQKH